MRYRSSSNYAGFAYMYELKSGALCLTACANAELVNGHGNKLGFQTFTRLATYSKAEQSQSDLRYFLYKSMHDVNAHKPQSLPLIYRLK